MADPSVEQAAKVARDGESDEDEAEPAELHKQRRGIDHAEPQDDGEAAERRECEKLLEQIVAEEGQKVLGWRTIPTNNASLGETAVWRNYLPDGD